MPPNTFIRGFTVPAGRILSLPTPDAVEEHVVASLVARANRQEMARTTLASGATFAGIFRRLRKLVDSGGLSFAGVTFHHLDEFEGVEAGSSGSMAAEISTALFPDENDSRGWFFPMDATADDESVAAHEKDVAGCNLILLGIGPNGHIAFNEPGTPFSSRSHFAALAPETRAAHAARFRGRGVPERALTAGIQTILSAAEIVVVAVGESKARAVAEAIAGPISPDCPASALRLHDRVTWVLDEAAAAGLDELPGDTVGSAMRIYGRGSADPPGPTLVVAPHPDDAGISCGGLLSLGSDREKKHIVTFSTGARGVPGLEPGEARNVREKESQEEARILGASVSFLRAKAYDSGVFEPEDAAALLAVLEEVRPARILLPSSGDPHPTHRLCKQTVDEAVRAWFDLRPRLVEIWAYEGPWCQLDHDGINVLVVLDEAAHKRKQTGILAHRSQVERVPFHAGADALERLRAIAFSESHFGGRNPRGFDHSARVECYSRTIIGPDAATAAQYSSSR